MLRTKISNPNLHNRLQLSCIPYRVLNHLSTSNQYLLLRPHILLRLGEVCPSIFYHPTFGLRKLHHTPFAVQEEQILGICYR